MRKRIHIVSFDVPYPADYGGVIDVFTRVKWFSENGFEVILHCFEYKRPKAKELDKYAEVHYYPRPTGLKYWFSKLPFIVNTRINEKLELILQETKDEVLLEGLHCAHYLNLQPRKFHLRTHNIEHEYYEKLATKGTFLKQFYYRSEAKKLKAFEPILAKAKSLLVISEGEINHFKKINAHSVIVPSIIENPEEQVETKPFVLFHGNLSVEENHEAANWILDNITLKMTDLKFVIAGKNPSEDLKKKCTKNGVDLVASPSAEEMEGLIQTARIHLLWTSNASGLKLKLMQSLASSGHVLCSPEFLAGTKVESAVHVYDSGQKAIELIEQILGNSLPEKEFILRRELLNANSGVQKLKELFLD